MNKDAKDMALFAKDEYVEAFKENFTFLCEYAGWPPAIYRELKRFFRTETSPAYWDSLPPIEAQTQMLQWVYAEHRDAPAKLWAHLPLEQQLAAALQWLDTEKPNADDDSRSTTDTSTPPPDGGSVRTPDEALVPGY